MRKLDIAKSMAQRAGVTEGEAADRLDAAVARIVSRLRKGQETELPGLGKLMPGPDGKPRFEGGERRGSRG